MSERAQLEKERRARQKRLRKAQGLPDSDDEEKVQNDEDEERPSAKRQRLSSSSYAGQPNARSSTNSGSQSSSSKDSFFWDGEWRPTAVQGSEPREDGRPTFRLSEVLGSVSIALDEAWRLSNLISYMQKTEIAFAILSTFALDIPWIYSLFDPSVPVIMVSQPDASGKTSVKNVLPNWIKTAPFLRNGYGCMHMKVCYHNTVPESFLILLRRPVHAGMYIYISLDEFVKVDLHRKLFYKTGRLRVVVSTANLIAFDWRDIENVGALS